MIIKNRSYKKKVLHVDMDTNIQNIACLGKIMSIYVISNIQGSIH